MHVPDFDLPLFTNLLILLVVSRLFGEVFERMRQPAMIGEILAGILLGPSVLDIIHRTEAIQVISELGIFLLVIIAGLEINIDDILKSLKGKNIIISLMAFFLPIASGLAVGYFFGLDAMTTTFIGLCVAITALPVSIRILMDLGMIHSDVGQKIITVAIFDDILALTILGVLLNIKDTDMSFWAITKAASISFLKLNIFIIILIGAYYLLKRFSKTENFIEHKLNQLLSVMRGKEALFALFFAFILIFSTVTETLGFHFIIGAFFGALLIHEKVIGKNNLQTIEKTTNSLAMGLLAPVFFAGIGLEFSISSIQNYGLLIAVLAVSYLSKIIGGYAGGRFAGFSGKFSFTIAIGLNARGIMELVIANIAYKAGIISSEVFSILVIMGVLTTLTTPLILKRSYNAYARSKLPDAAP